MNTSIINYQKNRDEIKQELLEGNILAFPTETVYGIGCDLFNINAVFNIFSLKGRSINKPLAAHLYDISQVELLSDKVPDIFYRIAEKFLPGPLSLIIPKNNKISSLVTGGLNTIGIRIPDNYTFFNIAKEFNRPIAATSANESGKSDKISSKEVMDEFKGKIRYIVDDNDLHYKQASTVLSLVGNLKLLREGAIPKYELEDFLKMNI
jgi:L-threonylcarbamoyladenylate synthase